MKLKFQKSVNDIRGRIIFCKYGDLFLNIVETKKGFSRGGHYHNFDSEHFLLSGKVEFREKNLVTNEEKISMINSPSVIKVISNSAHLLTALEDTLFVEYFENAYSATDYSEYRSVVIQKMTKIKSD